MSGREGGKPAFCQLDMSYGYGRRHKDFYGDH
jgi:hypothetical protein